MNQTERPEQYLQTVVKHLPGGMAVIRHEVGGVAAPEYLSDGFSEMLDMPKEAAWKMYQRNVLSGVHPDDREYVKESLDRCIREKKKSMNCSTACKREMEIISGLKLSFLLFKVITERREFMQIIMISLLRKRCRNSCDSSIKNRSGSII